MPIRAREIARDAGLGPQAERALTDLLKEQRAPTAEMDLFGLGIDLSPGQRRILREADVGFQGRYLWEIYGGVSGSYGPTRTGTYGEWYDRRAALGYRSRPLTVRERAAQIPLPDHSSKEYREALPVDFLADLDALVAGGLLRVDAPGPSGRYRLTASGEGRL
jgi:hypothetical protein